MLLDIVCATQDDLQQYALHSGYTVIPGHFRGISAVDKNRRLLGVIGFDYWTPSSVQMHVWYASPMALRGGVFLKEAFTYAFVTNKRKVAFGVIPSDNEKALKFIWHVGFKEVARLKDGWDVGTDMVINEMRPEFCRWL